MPCFYSIHLGIEVYEDGELIYDLKPVPGIFGTTPGSVWNFLEIEPGCGQVIVRTHAAYRRVGGETLSFISARQSMRCCISYAILL